MKRIIAVLLAIAALCSSFSGADHFITDPALRRQVENDFTGRMAYIGTETSDNLLRLAADPAITTAEKEALWFLLAYCPLCDLADCEPEYFLRQVRGAFRAREYFSWGESVPEDVFRHFVLPHRVNNENLDEARDVFFGELRERIGGMSMYDAALEVNHWCHEKVEYRATDARTSSPLALVKTSWGRCGEESAFTATALRAVGIPARQVYTPRWVHTDSNHAWVEVWIDGRWHYMGACEPEPELDMAWFTQPATRAMMMHTTVFGKYDGPEEVSLANELYTVINLLEIYAPTRRIEITVRDGSGRAVPDAEVKYKVYNYAEFYPIATHITDQQGKSTLTTGFGDLVVWASQGDSYGYSVIAADTDTADVTIEPGSPVLFRDFTLGVPPERQGRQVHSDKVAENRRRLAVEDSIRNAYMSGFMPGGELIGELARKTGMEYDRVYHFLNEAQGNAGEIVNFLSARQRSPWLEEFLGSLTSKDLRDTPERYLSAFLPPGTTPPYGVPNELVPSKILSPRIEMEIIRPWREPLTEFLASRPELDDPYSLVEFVRNNIRVDDSQNYVACRITPGGVHATRLADRRSRDIYFVALCRAARIAAHIDRATGKPQFYMDGDWHDALLDDSRHAASVPPMGTIVFDSHEDNRIVPAYRSHFTVARYSDGDFSTLDLSGRLRGRDYPTRAEVPAGYYRLTAGSRANDGSVAVHNRYFEVAEGDIVELLIALPDTRQKLFVEGILDMNTIVFLADGTKTTLKDQALGQGLILVFADPANEPTRHVLQEMPAFRERLEQWGGGIVFAVPDDLAGATINEGIFPGLPSQAIWLPDGGNALLNAAVESLRLDFQSDFPLCLYLNTSGGILFSGSGYSPGTVERIYRTISAERQPGQAL